MEKRFELFIEELILIHDHKTKHNYDEFDLDYLTDLLNEQDKKIKELESQVVKWKQDYENCSKLEKNMSKEHQYCLNNWRESEEENRQLKEEIKQLKFDCSMYKSAKNSKAIEALESIAQFMDMYKGNFYPKPFIIRNFIQEQITKLKEKK